MVCRCYNKPKQTRLIFEGRMNMFTYSKAVAREFESDVLVIGGGPAGFGAAVAAARNGASTILIERNAMLGGMANTGLVGPFMTCYDDDCTEQIVKGNF